MQHREPALVANVVPTNTQRRERVAVRLVRADMEVAIIQQRDPAAVRNVLRTNTGTVAAVVRVEVTHIQRPDLMG